MRTYRSVGDPAGLLPAERDPVTGRRVTRRDDKRRHRHRARRPRRPWLVGGAVAVVIIATAAVVAALAGGDDSSSSTDRARTRGGSSSGTAHDIVAGAISADYSGGRLVTKTCVDAKGGPCTGPNIPWEPVSVRCTAAGCTATIFNTSVPIGDAASAYSTAFGYEAPECGTAPVTGTLRGVGHVLTHGVERPQRIVGTMRIDAPAHVIPQYDCLGGVQEFRYNATAG